MAVSTFVRDVAPMAHIYATLAAGLISFSTWLLKKHLRLLTMMLRDIQKGLADLGERVAHLEDHIP